MRKKYVTLIKIERQHSLLLFACENVKNGKKIGGFLKRCTVRDSCFIVSMQ